MGDFVNRQDGQGRQIAFDFSFQNQTLTKEQKAERKIYKRIARNNRKRRYRIADNKELIGELVAGFGDGETLHIISDSIDSPNIINAFVERIEEIYISTWSITPAGIACLENLASNGCLPSGLPPRGSAEPNELGSALAPQRRFRYALLVLDRTHSYKWIFSSGAYKCLQGKIDIRITAIHSKFIVLKLDDGSVLKLASPSSFAPRQSSSRLGLPSAWRRFVGSMNLSNNPRWENLTISKDPADFEFYRDFLLNIPAEKLK